MKPTQKQMADAIVAWMKRQPSGMSFDYAKITMEIKKQYPHLSQMDVDFIFNKAIMTLTMD